MRAAGRQHAERITQYAVITDDTERENESERGAKGYSKLDARTSDDNLAPSLGRTLSSLLDIDSARHAPRS